jgi:methionine synthase II (cobalamin-independent)
MTDLASGLSVGIGSLPHRDASSAAAFALEACELPTMPTLPRRSAAEGMIAQAVVGLEGVTIGQYGGLSVDARRVDPLAPVVTDIDHEAFGGFRALLDAATGRTGPVKWQLVGPVTLGFALERAGVPASLAFDTAVRAVRSHVQVLSSIVAKRLPGCQQVVFLDEPSFGEAWQAGSSVAPDTAIDLLSGALAAVEPAGIAGVHSCGSTDTAALLAAGPSVLSLPALPELVEVAGYLASFLERGGWVAWGVVPTDGPIPQSVERPWRTLSALWCQLVQRGCDPVLLRRQAMVSPACGLALHAEEVADRVFRLTREVAGRVRDQAVATRLTIGA